MASDLIRAVVALAFETCVFGPAALATPVPPINVPALIGHSDVIVTGRLSGPTGKQALSTLHVDQAIQGPVSSGAILSFDPRRFSPPGTFPTYGIFFLHGSAGNWERADPHVSALVAAPAEFEKFGAQAGALETIAAELVSVFTMPDGLAADPRRGLAHLAITVEIPHGRDHAGVEKVKSERASQLRVAEDVYFRAWDALRSIPPDVKRPFLLKVIDSNGPLYGRLWALSTLLMVGDFSRMDFATAYLLHPSEQARFTNTILKLALTTNVFPESYDTFFARLLASSNERIRESAAYQLGMMHSTVALNSLDIALHDEDPDVRLSALRGVCRYVEGCGNTDRAEAARPENVRAVADAFHAWLESNPL